MPAHTLRSAGLRCCSLLLFSAMLIAPAAVAGEEILTVKNPAAESPSMPAVLFNHDKHVAYVEKHDSDCSRCHRVTSQGLSLAVLDVNLQKPSRQTTYIHAVCTDCHKSIGHGPSMAECRSCHAQGNTLRAMK